MTKPVIIKRIDKGEPLTYAEQDQNFQNLKDATVSLVAGSGGTSVAADLNGTITLVAGTGITLSGDNSAKTVTISGSSSIGTDNITLGSGSNALVSVHTGVENGNLNLYGGSSATVYKASLFLDSGSTDGITLDTEYPGANIYISPGDLTSGNVGKVHLQGVTTVISKSTTERDAITNQTNGDLLFNSTTKQFEGYAGATNGWMPLGVAPTESATYASSATVDFANFSGLLLINNTGTTGQVAMYLCGGGSANLFGYSSSSTPHGTGAMSYVSGINGYRWTNNTGISDTFNFTVIKTRNTA